MGVTRFLVLKQFRLEIRAVYIVLGHPKIAARHFIAAMVVYVHDDVDRRQGVYNLSCVMQY